MNSDYDIISLSHEIKRIMEYAYGERMEDFGLRKVEVDILYFIAHAGNKDTARDIINAQHISKAHISKSVDNLRQKGYTLLESQWRCRFGELDLVAKDKRGLLCIVEVKLRGSGSIALPREFVDGRKQQRLRSAAELYLAANELDVPVRFDVAEVYDEGGSLRISYIENAFI